MIAIRPATPNDASAICGILVDAGLRANSEPHHLDWKYWRERSDAPGPRSFVLTRGDEILAHAAVVPGVCHSDTQRLQTLHAIDWAARPTAMGAGARLMKYLSQRADMLLAVGGSAQTLQLLPHLGFRPLGKAICYVRSLHPLRLMTPSIHPSATLLPRVGRALLWKAIAPSIVIDGWRVRPLDANDLSEVETILPSSRQGMSVFGRSEELFRYALECPISSMALFGLEREGRLQGYFLLSFALRQARLADCWMNSEEPSDWRTLLQCVVVKASEHPTAAELAAWASDDALSRHLQKCGFRARGELPVQVLAPNYPEITSAPLRVQMIDNDAAYRHSGRNAFWA